MGTRAWTKVGIIFFQAEDGIRDHCVTGVQTCALPISRTIDLGVSIVRGDPVLTDLLRRFPATVELATAADRKSVVRERVKGELCPTPHYHDCGACAGSTTGG